ncbi:MULTISPECIES: lipid IV(A) palmitoyltransferase PagP [Legionella]|uniref:Antimicrobial peptide resistance and Lipid A acylation protein PagP n=1 Tax=Legionella maceachernii TaxID=466 RepID=A0A0W0VVK3_9GAMM|nr:lipid IV(A) palmitoyltransferase PagP [Legionella maceachernii]KTD24053.1 Antimicrobial peptide resistance and Lipid A acylation protein PagP [Legionella maceachernii]SJZ85013.1 palmitoyl transferase [Legionella maceachernii]SUO99261.1 Lipid A palmitoyltransferase PagP precursor [Legionella maceachernii]
MKKIPGCLLFFFLHTALAHNSIACSNWPAWIQPVCHRLYQIWTEGNNELYLSGYAWHNRFVYPKTRIKRFNEQAWGGGLGKGLFDGRGNWRGLFAIAFLDSHKNVEPAIGYAFLKVMSLSEQVRFGVGYSVLVTARPDILHGIPFPGAIPWVSINFNKVSIAATYIPGGSHSGNVLFMLGKWSFDFF